MPDAGWSRGAPVHTSWSLTTFWRTWRETPSRGSLTATRPVSPRPSPRIGHRRGRSFHTDEAAYSPVTELLPVRWADDFSLGGRRSARSPDGDRSLVSERGCVITGWGTALPPTVVTNKDLESILDTSDEWIVERSGVRTRRSRHGPLRLACPRRPPCRGARDDRHPGHRGRAAGARIRPGAARARSISSWSARPPRIRSCPAPPPAVAGALGITGGAVDLNAACAGFTYGLITAAGMLAAGARKVLLIGAETMTRTLNWEDRTNAFLFGDGAGALVLEAVERPRLAPRLGCRGGRHPGRPPLCGPRRRDDHAGPGGLSSGRPGHGRLGERGAAAGQGGRRGRSPSSSPTRPTSGSWRR